jgi:phage shock protein PspC (stress-responsive transcriptional regulator)
MPLHTWAMGLRRAAVALPMAKGLLFGVVGGLALALSFDLKGPEFSFVPFALFVYSIPLLVAAIVYLIAAFLLARARAVWRVPGALLDAAASLMISWALVAFFFGAREAYGDAPFAISIAVAAAWAATSLPALLRLVRQTRLSTGSGGSSKR